LQNAAFGVSLTVEHRLVDCAAYLPTRPQLLFATKLQAVLKSVAVQKIVDFIEDIFL
jgi:hypothetical protein